MKLLFSLILTAFTLPLSLVAQQKDAGQDSLVVLLSAKSMELIEKDGVNWRKVTGPARFLHNATFLICDTALWNVDTNVIDALGNVKILQEETVLTSDAMKYIVDQDLAQFRGSVVQLEDKDHNMLRTRHLDYNTKDSVAVFQDGGSMRDKDGQIIESLTGTYDSKIKTFTFVDNVNMFTDSIFVKTSRLSYNTDNSFAVFGRGTDAWKEEQMLSSDAGWYDRLREIFFFNKDVHGLSNEKEGWSDSLYFYRNTMDVDMRGRVQLTDTVRKATALAGKAVYTDSLAKVVLTRDAAVIGVTDDSGSPADTVYYGADTLIYRTLMKYQIDSSWIMAAEERLRNTELDAIAEHRRKAAEAAAKAAEEASKNDPNAVAAAEAQKKASQQNANGEGIGGGPDDREKLLGASEAADDASASAGDGGTPDSGDIAHGGEIEGELPEADLHGKEALPEAGSLASGDLPGEGLPDLAGLPARDSLLYGGLDSLEYFRLDSIATARADSIARAVADSIAIANRDSTKVTFLTGLGHGKLFREDMQIVCDSLEYSDLDSLVRLYKAPFLWNEYGRHQYTADSLIAVINNNKLERADLLSNAFVIIQEDETVAFDQIRGAEMLAFFDEDSNLSRFDVLGEASAIFYLREDSTYATVNKSQSKMLYAIFRDGDIETLTYFETVESDVHPLAQMKNEDRVLKGYNWQPDLRPKSRYDITELPLRTSQREEYEARPKATFEETNIYYPGYMDDVYKAIEDGKAAKARREKERKAEAARADSLERALADSIALAEADSLALVALRDSLARDSLAIAGADSLAAMAADSLGIPAAADSTEAEFELKPILDAKSAAAMKRGAGRAAKEAAKEAVRAEKMAAREAEWARLDSLDAVKARLKADKKIAKQRVRRLALLEAEAAQAAKDSARLEKYRLKYEAAKARKDARKKRGVTPGDSLGGRQADSLRRQPSDSLEREDLPQADTSSVAGQDADNQLPEILKKGVLPDGEKDLPEELPEEAEPVALKPAAPEERFNTAVFARRKYPRPV